MQYDVDVSAVPCGCAAGVYLSVLNDDTCKTSSYPMDVTPQCATLELMEANVMGFNQAVSPCLFGSCEVDSQCKRRLRDQDQWAYGPNVSFKIDTSMPYSVKSEFFVDLLEYEGSIYKTDISNIVTTLT